MLVGCDRKLSKRNLQVLTFVIKINKLAMVVENAKKWDDNVICKPAFNE